jgi:antirestriction protein
MEQHAEPSLRLVQPAEIEGNGPTPRIYVASLADYNDGRLHGRWIDATQDEEVLHAEVADMLAASPLPDAEEYAIHDHENFAGLRLDEYESLVDVARLAHGITNRGSAFARWAELVGTTNATIESFQDHYLGSWSSLADYASEFATDLGFEEYLVGIPPPLRPYVRIDEEGIVRDMLLGGDIDAATDASGVHIFLPP